MKSKKIAWLGLIAALLLTGSTAVFAQPAQQTGDRSQSGSSTAKKNPKKPGRDTAGDSNAQASTPSKPTVSAQGAASHAAAASATADAAKPVTAQKNPPAATATVWVNTGTRVYHKPGSRWYGKTKRGKYMTEADAIKAGYRAAGKE